jgi:hypothetical protein
MAKTVITKGEAISYLAAKGLRCPKCSAETIGSDSLDADGPEARADCWCEACGASWVDVYTLTAIEEDDDADDEDGEDEL